MSRVQTEGEGTLHADPMPLRNAMSSPVSNALQHTPAGGALTVSAAACDGGIEFATVESGSGIAAEHLPHLFERFYRVDAARRSGERTGLGLSVVASITDPNGGKVTVHSTPGIGSRFSFWVPGVAGPASLETGA